MRKIFKISIGCIIVYAIIVLSLNYLMRKYYLGPSEFPDPGDKTPVITVGGKIIFNSNRPEPGLYILKDGEINIFSDIGGIARLSPDGKKVLFSYKNSTFAIMDLDANIIEKIIDIPKPYHPTGMDWSPDSQHICFTADPIDDNKSFNNLYIYNMDTNEVKQLTFFKGNTSWSIVNPKYSHDGSKIIFECPKNIEKGDCGAPISLFVINSDGTGLHELFGDKLLSGIQPSWSPDGEKIVFISMGEGEKIDYADVFICDFNTTEIKQLTNDYWQDEHPVFSPDGKQICYVSPRHGDYGFGKELFVINIDGTGMARVTPPYRREKAKGIFAKWAGDDYPQWSR